MKLTALHLGLFITIAAPVFGSGTDHDGPQSSVEKYSIDSAHSSINFKIRHFFSPVPGSFASFTGSIVLDRENMANCYTEAKIEVASVNTNNQKRDQHLNKEDFFNSSIFPAMLFKSTNWQKAGENRFKVTGDLTILHTTKPVVLDVKLLAEGENNRGHYLTGWEGKTTLDRTDFGITYGQGIVGNEVTVEIFVEAKRI